MTYFSTKALSANTRRTSALSRKIFVVLNKTDIVSQSALARRCPDCVRALEIFASIYGAEAGNLALKVLATGGVYIGGGIPPRILPWLKDGNFVGAFGGKGRFAALMKDIPVHVITVQAALLGAARHAAVELGN